MNFKFQHNMALLILTLETLVLFIIPVCHIETF